MVLSLEHLPEEILHCILCHCDPSCSAALEQTARCFKPATNQPLLWRLYCQTLFKFWDNKHCLSKKLSSPVSRVNWKSLYISRHLVDRSTTHFLNSILVNQTGRIEKFRAIIDFGYDAKDTLLRHMSVKSDTEDHLARRYYAKSLLTCLHRSIAIREWARLGNGEIVPLERALGAFDLFIPESRYGSLDEISIQLDSIVTSLLADYPGIVHLTFRERALAIASYLRANNMTGIGPGREYHSLVHNFLGYALTDPDHNSLPLVSAVIYCYVAQKIGLDARPCGFPFHVHVIIMPPIGLDIDGNVVSSTVQGEPIYVDPFRSERETSVSYLQSQLNFLGASTLEQSTFLGESLTSEIVLRCGKNILNSVQHLNQTATTHSVQADVTSARYAAFWSSILMSGPSRPVELRQNLPWLMELFATDFPSDIYLIEQYIVPLFHGTLEYEHILESLHAMCTVDGIPKQPRRRTSQHKHITYKVGQVFRHRRYDYRAIITGWDAECGAGEQWMRRMGIDHLQAGRHQSFYHVLVEDKSARYVAEENVELIRPHISELPRTLCEIAGKHFKRWDEDTQTFVSNIRDEYPDD